MTFLKPLSLRKLPTVTATASIPVTMVIIVVVVSTIINFLVKKTKRLLELSRALPI